jgi:proliferating cell nuclear antigen
MAAVVAEAPEKPEEQTLAEFAAPAGILKEFAAIVRVITKEAVVKMDAAGLRLTEADTSHVSLVEASLPAAAFARYECPKEIEAALDLDKLKDVLSLVDAPEDEVVVRFVRKVWKDGKESFRWHVRIGHLLRTMAPWDISGYTRPRVPKLDLAAGAEAPASVLRAAVRAAESINTDHLQLSVSGIDGIEIRAGEAGGGDSIIARLEGDGTARIGKADARASYPTDFIAQMTKAIPEGKVRVLFQDDYPVRLAFAIAGGKGEASYLLAPRIDDGGK